MLEGKTVPGMPQFNMSKQIGAKLRNGRLYRLGLITDDQIDHLTSKVVQIIRSDCTTVRMVFPDQHGILRGKVICKDRLPSFVADGIGMPSTLLLKDTSHRTVFPVWSQQSVSPPYLFSGAADIVAVPDMDSIFDFNWLGPSKLILCDLIQRDGAIIEFAPRQLLRSAIKKLESAGYRALIGLEVEFQIFKVKDRSLQHTASNMPPKSIETENTTQGWQYLTEIKYSEVSEILEELRACCETLNLGLQTIEIEMGPSQFEFTFSADSPLVQADKYVLFRTMVKEICAKNGLHATFMAKPVMPNSAANGWHIHQSLIDAKTGVNAFMKTNNPKSTAVGDRWIAGLLNCASECCILTTPTVNGFKRYQPNQLAPVNINWGYDNRGVLIRSLIFDLDPNSRVENRAAESAANPYYAIASQLASGLHGLKSELNLPPPATSPYSRTEAQLPQTLGEAITAFKDSEMLKLFFGEHFVDYLCTIKAAEWQRYTLSVSQWEQDEYFNNF